MDKGKQPGIGFDGIMLVKEEFYRKQNIPNENEIDLNLKVNVGKNKDGKSVVELTANLSIKEGGNECANLSTTFIGLFSVISGSENMGVEEYLETNAVALMFPYIREHVSAITLKAGMDPVYLPPINVPALIREKKTFIALKNGDDENNIN